jgi:ABC-type Na+ transport system ATPase subunit NatA
MRENEPVLLVLSVCDGKIILEKGEILYEKCHVLLAQRSDTRDAERR